MYKIFHLRSLEFHLCCLIVMTCQGQQNVSMCVVFFKCNERITFVLSVWACKSQDQNIVLIMPFLFNSSLKYLLFPMVN